MAHCISQRRDAELSGGKTPVSKVTRRWSALDKAVKRQQAHAWNEAAEGRFHNARSATAIPIHGLGAERSGAAESSVAEAILNTTGPPNREWRTGRPLENRAPPRCNGSPADRTNS